MLPPPPLSPTDTLVDGKTPQRISPARRYMLLIVFCLAQFLDACNNASLFSAIPSLIIALGITESESTWVISAFQLTFASFLLVSGRISDVYNPKAAFIIGLGLLGLVSIAAGFSGNKVVLIVLRALTGIAASLTIPSALTLIVNVFPEPLEQARAIGAFGGCGAVGNVLGLIIGAIFVQYTSWHWIFWFLAFMTLPIAFICIFLIPPQPDSPPNIDPKFSKLKSLDMVGVSILTVALILFIFALTSGSTSGWDSAMVLAPLVISIFLIISFFLWEKIIPSEKAAVPPQTWFYPNFSILFAVALMPFFWWTTIFTVYTTLWQNVYHWSVISSAVHMIPIGVLSFAVSFTGPLSRIINPKWIIMTGQSFMLIATVLLVFADGPDKYWSFVFPAFVVGSAGANIVYTHTNIAIFQTTPSSMAGTVGAIFNGALQLGSAIGLAAVTSIETSVEAIHGGFDDYHGRAAVFWFMFGVLAVQTVGVLIFYRSRTHPKASNTIQELDDDKVAKTRDSDSIIISQAIQINSLPYQTSIA